MSKRLLAIFVLSLSTFTQAQDGAALFTTHCAACHLNPNPQDNAHAPSKEDMSKFTPNVVYAALTDGMMRLQGAPLSDVERRAVATHLTGKQVTDVALQQTTNLCASNPLLTEPAKSPLWNGWGSDRGNNRYAVDGGIRAADLPKLKLKWAYGLPGESQPRGQPSVVAGRLYVGNRAGALYSLDANSGCTYWTFLPRAGIRSATTIAPVTLPDSSNGYAVYFVDMLGNAYAVNAQTGQLLWQTLVDAHPSVRGTGSVTVHNGRVYVPMTGVNEENTASNPDYSCCTFRGSLTSLDAQTGDVIWKFYTVDEPKPRGTSANGKPLFGPAGVGIWSAPTVDEKRNLIYVATGNAYADPAPATSDAVLALSIDKGQLVWSKQLTMPSDTWVGGCSQTKPNANCPEQVGPDFDFSASPILTTNKSGRELLVIPQKSGMVYALDPTKQGEVVWQYKAGEGSAAGGVWGSAVAEGVVYVAVGGYRAAVTGGVHGIDLETGQRQWFTPPQPLLCAVGAGCGATQSAAVTAIPGAVFSGSQDGGMRAYAAQTGEVLWTFDANKNFETINGVVANGASFDGAGPTVAGGMLYMLSGNSGFVGRPGNVLLAFEIAE
jgi:polyvinyl alcohol dehydrogenase (cytochrome)